MISIFTADRGWVSYEPFIKGLRRTFDPNEKGFELKNFDRHVVAYERLFIREDGTDLRTHPLFYSERPHSIAYTESKEPE